MAKMVKVRAKVSMAGTLSTGAEFSMYEGQVLLLPEEDAKKFTPFHVERAAKDEPLTETAAFAGNDFSFLEGDDPRLMSRMRGYNPL